MLTFKETWREPGELQLGCHLEHVDYLWKPFEARDPAHQADYRRLWMDVITRGLVNPLIVFRDCVLIGQRRCEIARKVRISRVRCWEIQDDITHDADPSRVKELMKLYEDARY